MKILILADSRAMWPREYNWPKVFSSTIGPKHEVYTYISGVDKWLVSIHMMEEYLLKQFPDTIFDLIVLQAGWHEGGPCFWPKSTWEEIINTSERKFDESKLTQEVESEGKKKYLYIDRETEGSILETFKKKSRNLLVLGLQNLRKGVFVEYKLGVEASGYMIHHYEALKSNDAFSKNTDFLNFPMDNNWVNFSCLPDRVHYNYNGVNFVAAYVSRSFNRMNHTVNALLATSANHKKLYEQAISAGATISRHTKDKDVVLISGPSSECLTKYFLGCILYGRIPLIIQHPSNKVSEKEFNKKMEEIENKTSPSLCICDEKDEQIFQKFFPTLSNVESSEPLELSNPSKNDVAFLQLSSGTTGNAKILKVTHSKLIENCHEYGVSIGLSSSSSIASWLPLYHDMGLITSFLMPIVFDCKFNIIDTFDWLADPAKLLKLIDKEKSTHIWMPNFAFSYMQKIKDSDIEGISLQSIKHWISCSEPTHARYLNSFFDKFAKYGLNPVLNNCYAMAENVFAVSQSSGGKLFTFEGQQFLSCGRPIPGVSVLIVDQDDNDVPEGAGGRVTIKSNTLVHTERNQYGYYDTGDLGFMIDGELFITGRAKDSFISYGNNIYPHLIELQINNENVSPGRIACFPIFDEEKGTNRVGIAVESKSDQISNIQKDISLSIKELYDISPEVFVEKPMSLIKTSSGKISRVRTGEKIITKNKMLKSINEFLLQKNKPLMRWNDSLYSSGVLDSLDMLELMLFLEKANLGLDKEALTKDSFKIDLQKIDDLDGITSLLGRDSS